MRTWLWIVLAIVAPALMMMAGATASWSQLIGPAPSATTPYLSFTDSPFNGLYFTDFHLEDFEDHLLNVPGVTGDHGGVASVVFGPSIHDSVDADDGVVDGSGLNGDDWFSSSGAAGVKFTFDAGVLGGLPTHAGMVWTDGGENITFEAFDQNGVSMGTLTGTHGDNSVVGETAEDRFYGAINAAGISAIKLSNPGGGIELDHLQYGRAGDGAPVPEPGTLALLTSAALGLVRLLRRRRA